jgi:hypothetical protein
MDNVVLPNKLRWRIGEHVPFSQLNIFGKPFRYWCLGQADVKTIELDSGRETASKIYKPNSARPNKILGSSQLAQDLPGSGGYVCDTCIWFWLRDVRVEIELKSVLPKKELQVEA